MTYALNDTLQAKLGKYVTLLGAEVIDNTGNFNISRSFLFGHAIPFTHNGLRLTYTPSDRFQMNIGVVNGWDKFVEENNTKSLEWNVEISYAVNDTLQAKLGKYVTLLGAEVIDNTGNYS